METTASLFLCERKSRTVRNLVVRNRGLWIEVRTLVLQYPLLARVRFDVEGAERLVDDILGYCQIELVTDRMVQ